MKSKIEAVVVAVLLGTASGQIQQTSESATAEPPQVQTYSVKADVFGPDGVPIQSAFLELYPEAQNEAGVRVGGSPKGRVAALSVKPGRYSLTIEAGGFNNLSRTIAINKDVDLGRIVMDVYPNIVHVFGASLCCFGPPDSLPKEDPTTPLEVRGSPVVFRGHIQPASIFNGRRLVVQMSCSEQLARSPQRPQTDIASISVDNTGFFETTVPPCMSDLLAHRELRFSLKGEDGATLALLLPKMAAEGFYQSRFGIWLPLKPMIPQMPVPEATFFPEFTDNRPLQAKISVGAWSDPFPAGSAVFLSATLTNTSQEVLSISYADFVSDYAWVISDEHGNRVPFHLYRDRTGEPSASTLPRSRFLFPGESETHTVNIGQMFTFGSPGIYHVLARRIVRRPEIPGEEQITSPEFTFVIMGK